MSTHARDIINRLAALDEATVAEPEVEPDVIPAEPAAPPAPSQPRPTPRHDPYTFPPDWDEPGQMPRPKAEDDTESIEGWLQATRQPITDWEWDGQELRLLMNDGSTEVYTHQQLSDIGVLNGEMAFAESQVSEECECEHEHEEGAPDEATGVLDAILGRAPCPSSPQAEEMVQIEGEPAEKLAQAVSDVVTAILGIVDQGGEAPEGGEKPEADKKPEDSDKDEKPSKKSKDKEEPDKEETEEKESD